MGAERLDAARREWKFDEVPTNLWSSAHTNINSGGGLWDPPTFDGHGNLYIGVSNPAPFPGTAKYPWGSSRPGPNLYTDSIVKLDEKTGKLLWYYQLTPHDIYDWDLENSPILATAGGQQIVIDGGKAGILVAVNAQTGKLLWKRPVGVHNGHDNDGLYAEQATLEAPHPGTVEPGDLGGIESQLATNGTTVFAAVNNLPCDLQGPERSRTSNRRSVQQGHRRSRRGQRGHRPDRVGRQAPVLALRRRDARQRRRVHDHVRRDAVRVQRHHRQGTLATRALIGAPTLRSRSSATPCSPPRASRRRLRAGVDHRLSARRDGHVADVRTAGDDDNGQSERTCGACHGERDQDRS